MKLTIGLISIAILGFASADTYADIDKTDLTKVSLYREFVPFERYEGVSRGEPCIEDSDCKVLEQQLHCRRDTKKRGCADDVYEKWNEKENVCETLPEKVCITYPHFTSKCTEGHECGKPFNLCKKT